MTPSPHASFFSLAILAAAASAQRAWVVAPTMGPGVDFTVIQSAIDAAADGDTVIVRAGTYTTFAIDGKSLAVVSDNATVELRDADSFGMRIRNLRADQPVVVRGFTHRSTLYALTISGCQAPVTIEDCWFTVLAFTFIAYGASVYDAPMVTFRRCDIDCSSGRPGFSGPGLSVTSARVTLHQCRVAGGSDSLAGRSGHHGATFAANAFLFAAGTTFIGGSGGPGQSFGGTCGIAPGNGGHALVLSDAGSSAVLLACALQPGFAGAGATGCPPGTPGQPLAGSGSSHQLSGTPGELSSAPAPVRMGQTLTFSLRGAANAGAWLALTPVAAPVFVPGCSGVLHGHLGTSVILFVGFLSAGGQLSMPVPIPPLGVLSTVLHAQMGMTTGTGCYLGAPTALTIVDPRY